MDKPTDQDGLQDKLRTKAIISGVMDARPHSLWRSGQAILPSFERQIKHTSEGNRNFYYSSENFHTASAI